MKITVVTPSIRKKGVEVVRRCLNQQTFFDWEWLVCSPYAPPKEAIWIPEPKKRKGDYYNLNKCWNLMFKRAKGELVISIVDLIWFPPDTLERFWFHYFSAPKVCVGAIGHQYKKMVDGKPDLMTWRDPRVRNDFGSFYEINPNDLELCVASIPMQAIKDVGGVDETFDKYAALSEKEMCARMDKLGYSFWIDQSIEYRALKHPRLTRNWDQKYNEGCDYYRQCLMGLENGTRSPKQPYLKGGEKDGNSKKN